jgi:hypothetical protein
LRATEAKNGLSFEDFAVALAGEIERAAGFTPGTRGDGTAAARIG